MKMFVPSWPPNSAPSSGRQAGLMLGRAVRKSADCAASSSTDTSLAVVAGE